MFTKTAGLLAKMLVLVSTLYYLAACQSTQMRLADGPVQDQYLVTGANPYRWDTPVQAGKWQTTEMSDGGLWSAGFPLWKVELTGHYQKRQFITNSGVLAECRGKSVELSYRSIGLDPTFGHLPLLECRFAGPKPFSFALRADYLNRLSADFQFDDVQLKLESVHELEGSPLISPVPLGFSIKRDRQVLWSVETVNRGRLLVWQPLTEQWQDAFAAISFALLLTDFEALGG
ncbi:hypothetical protein [Bowmanella dokdonensis]|uniref:Uncharacterized protein n=1 Tax=Bowmanella dokdonensis TaxID=751969 RepID=A0A939IPB5_9ALTE|nr:hypothetical protein [Bowmanella dokdonensis]MBN7823814.1 hypothetical protein [Bowmanella dokdonensis]